MFSLELQRYLHIICAMRTGVIVIAALFVCTLASAQTFESSAHAVNTNFLLRIQRQDNTSASCVVVYPDHRAHYEMITGFGTLVAEGPLSPASAQEMDGLLQPLSSIDPRTITHKSQFDTLDIVIVNVMTARGLLNLHFSDPSVRKPFKASIDPALKWFAAARKGLPPVEASKKNNCVPENPNAPSPTQPEMPQLSARQAHALSLRMLFRADIFETDEGVVHESCTTITPDGRYRHETRTTSEAGAVSTAKVFEGKVDDAELSRLKEILNEPALVDSAHYPAPPNGVRARNSETVELSIPREDRLQKLRFFSKSGLAYVEPTPANQIVTTDTDEKLLKPIRSWLKDSIEKHKDALVPDGKPNHCSLTF